MQTIFQTITIMNITEISVKDRVLIECGKTREMAKVKGFLPDGRVLVETTEGKILSVAPECVLKKFS